MPERIRKPSLPVGTPRPLVVLEGVEAAGCTRCQGPGNQCIGLIAEQFDPGGGDAKFGWALPSVPGRASSGKLKELPSSSVNTEMTGPRGLDATAYPLSTTKYGWLAKTALKPGWRAAPAALRSSK